MAGQSKVSGPSSNKKNATATRKSQASSSTKEKLNETLQAIENQSSKRKRTDSTATASKKRAGQKPVTATSGTTKKAARKTSTSKTKALNQNTPDFVGTYKITSSAMEKAWNSPKGRSKGVAKSKLDLKMTVYHQKVKTKYQLFATFNFHDTNGLMRFESTIPTPSAITINKSNGVNAPEHIDSGRNSNGRRRDEDYVRKVFLLDEHDVPTAERAIWRYRWRGRGIDEADENGDEDDIEDAILGDADGYVQLIEFLPGGKLRGTFDLGGMMAFSGVKIEDADIPVVDPDQVWAAHGERAFKEEQAARTGEYYDEPDCEPNEMGDENYNLIRRRELKAQREKIALAEEEKAIRRMDKDERVEKLRAERKGQGSKPEGRKQRMEEKEKRRMQYRAEMMEEGYSSCEIDSDDCLDDEEQLEEEEDDMAVFMGMFGKKKK